MLVCMAAISSSLGNVSVFTGAILDLAIIKLTLVSGSEVGYSSICL